LHGESSNIPVAEVNIELRDDHAWISASFIYRSFEGNRSSLWYQRGKKLFEITRTLKIPSDKGRLEISDSIKNLSKTALVPDWGYHITSVRKRETS
jgi:hypothetical protein